MNRQDTKCAALPRYKTLAAAKAVAARKQTKHAAYACECGGAHVLKVGKTPKQQRRADQDTYYGELLHFVRATIDREISRLRAAGVHRRKTSVDNLIVG
jgi:hypothetical protein